MQKEDMNISCGESTPLETVFSRVSAPNSRQTSSRQDVQRPLLFRNFRRSTDVATVSTLEHLQDTRNCVGECFDSNLEEESMFPSGQRLSGVPSHLLPSLVFSRWFQMGLEHSPIEGKYLTPPISAHSNTVVLVSDGDCVSKRDQMDLESCDVSCHVQGMGGPQEKDPLAIETFLNDNPAKEPVDAVCWSGIDDQHHTVSPDSVSFLLSELQGLISYVESKPQLFRNSGGFVRDYLRTLLVFSSSYARQNECKWQHLSDSNYSNGIKRYSQPLDRLLATQPFVYLPDDVVKHILGFLEAEDLGRARRVCKKWYEYCSDDNIWKRQCLKRWRSLDWDEAAWTLVTGGNLDGPMKWLLLFPLLNQVTRFRCRLQKTGRFICNLVAHQFGGNNSSSHGLGCTLIVERRFNIAHLENFVLPDAARFYFEPETKEDEEGYYAFIEYLLHRNRAGLALEGDRRIIFIPPCDYSRNVLHYTGMGLLGIVQRSYPPLS
eukprot:jgi/Galph1/1923/GphlegSOOS_G594.1